MKNRKHGVHDMASFGTKVKNFLAKGKLKYKSLGVVQKVSVWLWLLCLILLFAFVGIILWHQQDKTVLAANFAAAFGLLFVLNLFASLLATVIPQVWKRGKK